MFTFYISVSYHSLFLSQPPPPEYNPIQYRPIIIIKQLQLITHMLQLPQSKCIMLNPGMKLCTTLRCPQPGIICGLPSCQCLRLHENCLNFTQIQSVLSRLIKKSESGRAPIQILLECCQYAIKRFEVQKSSLAELMREGEGLRDPEEMRFYTCLNNKRGREITGDFMSRVVGSLIQEPLIDCQKAEDMMRGLASGYKEYVDNIITNMQNIVREEFKKNIVDVMPCESKIRKIQSFKQFSNSEKEILGNPQQKKNFSTPTPKTRPSSFVYSKTLKSKNVKVNGMRASYIDEQEGNFSTLLKNFVTSKQPPGNAFLLLEPGLASIEDGQISVQFKVLNNKVYFGVSFRQILQECEFLCSVGDRYHGYSINCFGYVFSTIPEDNEKKTTFCGFSNGDTILLTFSSKYNKLRIINRTQNGELTIKAPNYFGRAMHFSVAFGSTGEVEYLGIFNER